MTVKWRRMSPDELREFNRWSTFLEQFIVGKLDAMTKDEIIDLLGRSYEAWESLQSRFYDEAAKEWEIRKEADDAE